MKNLYQLLSLNIPDLAFELGIVLILLVEATH
jgi:hypothetical protein